MDGGGGSSVCFDSSAPLGDEGGDDLKDSFLLSDPCSTSFSMTHISRKLFMQLKFAKSKSG